MKHAAPEPEVFLHQACAAAGGVLAEWDDVFEPMFQTFSRVTKEGRAREQGAMVSTIYS